MERHLEAHRPSKVGGLGDNVDKLQVAHLEKEASLLWGLLVRAVWTTARVCRHTLHTASACTFSRALHEAHTTWDCLPWSTVRVGWLQWVLGEIVDLPQALHQATRLMQQYVAVGELLQHLSLVKEGFSEETPVQWSHSATATWTASIRTRP